MNLNKYIGIPYLHQGRSLYGIDCYGIVWLIYKNEKNIILPDNLTYEKFWQKNGVSNPILDGVNSYNKAVTIYQPFDSFDIILFYNKYRNFVDHIGMYTESDRFIHIYRDDSSKIDRLEGYWDSRIFKGVRIVKNSI